MNFSKAAFGTLLLAAGAVLLAIPLGFAHPDTPLLLLRYWPVILIALGLAFLASVIKNPFLGCIAVLLILGGTVFGIFWMRQHYEETKASHAPRVSRIDLDKTRPSSLSLSVRTLAGRFYLGGHSQSKILQVRVRTFSGDSTSGYLYSVSGRNGVFEWPSRSGWLGLPPPGIGLDVRAPETLPIALSWRGRLASIHADLTRLKPTRCEVNGIASSILLGIKGGSRPEEIRVRGFASTVRIRIHGDCPVRLVTESPLIFKTLPSDFVPWGTGREKDRVYAAAGTGRPMKITVNGPFIHIAIERVLVTTVSGREDPEWLEVESTASRSRSPSS